MTHEENIQFKILDKISNVDTTLFSAVEYNKLVSGIEGAATRGYIFQKMKTNGYVTYEGGYINPKYPDRDYTEWKVAITDVGLSAYRDFKKRSRNETIKKIAFWVLFAASIVSAVYGVLSYYSNDKTNSQSKQKVNIAQDSPTINLPQKQTPDTIAVHLADSIGNPKKKK